jgi:hypothetical protein
MVDPAWSVALGFGAVLCWLFALFLAFAKPAKEPSIVPLILSPSSFKAVFWAVRARWLVVLGVVLALAALLL